MSTLWFYSFNAPSCKFKEAEYIFEFEGVKYRLIRGTVEESDKLLTMTYDSSQKGTDESFERASRLLDYLSWEWGLGIQLYGYGGIGRGFREDKENFETVPVSGFRPRNTRFRLTDISSIPIVTSDNQRFALRLWNEAESSNSPFLAFINYWSIVEIAPGGSKRKGVNHKKRAINWINLLPGTKINGLTELRKNLKIKYNYKKRGAGNFLYDEGRNAIAHVTKPKHFKRYDRESMRKIYELNKVMKHIANFYIKSRLKLGWYSQDLKILKTKKRTKALKLLQLSWDE
jgi:hypothetical protein